MPGLLGPITHCPTVLETSYRNRENPFPIVDQFCVTESGTYLPYQSPLGRHQVTCLSRRHLDKQLRQNPSWIYNEGNQEHMLSISKGNLIWTLDSI